MPIPYYQVDVFTDRPLSGNSLTVFPGAVGLSPASMLRLTQEMRHFESIFLGPVSSGRVRARVFTVEEELDFAGHPVLGAASVLHDLLRPGDRTAEWVFVLNKKEVQVWTEKGSPSYTAGMNQGEADFGYVLDPSEARMVLDWMNLSPEDLQPGCVPRVVSTGLPYLLLPLQRHADLARISIPDLEARMAPWGAKFIGVLEIPTETMRTWDNAGTVEDIATGSLAGPVGAYLVREGFRQAGETIRLQQGDHLGRPSRLQVRVAPDGVYVSGEVFKIAQGVLSTEASDTLWS